MNVQFDLSKIEISLDDIIEIYSLGYKALEFGLKSDEFGMDETTHRRMGKSLYRQFEENKSLNNLIYRPNLSGQFFSGCYGENLDIFFNNYTLDEKQLAVCEQNWRKLVSSYISKKTRQNCS